MNRDKTAQMLNEWKSFLNEGVKTEFSKEEADNEIEVKIVIKSDDTEFFSKEDRVKYSGRTGKLVSHDVNDRKSEETGKMTNFVVVSIDGKEKQFPDKCVKRV